MSEHPKPKGTFRIGVRVECNCGWHSQTHFGNFSEAVARIEWHEHLDECHRTPPTGPASQAQAAPISGTGN